MFSTLIRIHPATSMIMLIWLGAILQFMSPPVLLSMSLITILPATLFHFLEFVRLLRKTRVLLLMIGMMYAISTPGEYIFSDLPLWLSMSKEGLLHGAEQVFKMLVMLASLSIFLGTTRRDAILSGLYTLLLPCRMIGWNTDSMIARIYLTLEYVENSKNEFNIKSLPNVLAKSSEQFSEQASLEYVRFELVRMRTIDWLMCVFMLIALIIEFT